MIKSTSKHIGQRPSFVLTALAVGVAMAQPAVSLDVDGYLEEVVVTAQKREQNLQEVPVAVTALTGDDLNQAVIKDVYDLQTNVPALRAFQSQNSTQSSFAIRGVGTSSQNFGLESSVGLYVDGVYRSRQSSMINNMVDIEGVEVLRGPQGTLFGKNTPSGAILLRTKAPGHEQDGFVSATVGNYDLYNIGGAVNISAIPEVLAFRATAFSSKRDGFASVDGFGSDVLNDRDRWGVRLQALYTPSEQMSVRIIADHAEIDEICCASLTVRNNLTSTGGNPTPQAGTDNVIRALGGTVFSGDQFYDFRTALNHLPESTNEDRGLSAEVKYEFDESYTFTSISAYRAFDSKDTIDSDFSDADLFGTTNDSEQSSFSQEFRLDYSGDRMNFVLGAYYFEQDLDLDYSLFTNSRFNEFFMAGFAGPLAPILGGINNLNIATSGLIAAPALATTEDFRFDHLAKQEHTSYAIFGQADFNLSERFTLTMGLRYTDEDKELSTIYTEVGPDGNGLGAPPNPAAAGAGLATLAGILGGGGNPFDPNNQAAVDALASLAPFQTRGWGYYLIGPTTSPRPNINDSLPDSQVTGTVKLSFQANDEVLMYLSYGTGYKSGGTNTDRITNGFDPIFEAETSEALEFGLKMEFPDPGLRINAALHYTDVEDFQANSFTGNGFNLQNAGDIESYGGELELFWVPMETLEFSFNYAYLDAEYKVFEKGTCWVAYTFHTGVVDPGLTVDANGNRFCNRAGGKLTEAPEHNVVTSIKKEFQLGNTIGGYVQGEVTYTSDAVMDGNNDPYKIQESYSRLNLRAGLHFEDYDMDLTLWGRNVLDEEVRSTFFDVPIQAGKLMSYPREPRTFGLTLNKHF